MLAWPEAGDEVLDENWLRIIVLVANTLGEAGQLQYLNKNSAAIRETHDIVVDVDWYLERTQSDVGFHKDSRGTTSLSI